jgi:hypothetical protein
MLATAIAKRLAVVVDDLVYSEDEPGGNLFVAHMPAAPDVAVMVMPTGGPAQLTKAATDTPTVQLMARGAPTDARTPYALLRQAYDALTCLDLVTLDEGGPDEVHVITCTAMQSDPVPIGRDENDRPEFSQNYQFRTHAPTAHRPQITA